MLYSFHLQQSIIYTFHPPIYLLTLSHTLIFKPLLLFAQNEGSLILYGVAPNVHQLKGFITPKKWAF